MKNFLQRLLSVLLCILLVDSVSIAQEIPDPQDPKKQPLDKPTEAKEAPKKQDQTEAKAPILNAVSGGTPAGQTPTSTQDGTFVNRFQDIPVNLYTGTPIIGFPIYTLTEPGGVSVPLGLSYNATGMRGHDVSGWVGMNWTATFLFQISRIVRGIPDEGRYTLGSNFLGNFTTTARKGFYQYGLKADGDDENDSQPDLFFLNINGQSYKFSFDVNKKAHFYPEADIDLQVTWTAQNNTAVGKFSNWVVTMPDGSKYTFAGLDIESSFEIEANAVTNGSITYGTTNYGKYTLAETIVSAWYCNKIETAFGHQTNFEYYATNYSFFRVADQSTTTTNCTFNGIDKQINKVFVSSSTLFKISNQTHVVEINKGGWTSYIDANGDERWYISNTYPARSDLDTYTQNPTNSSNAKALHKLTVYAKDDPTKVFEWKFNYDYNSGNDPSNLFGIFTGYTYATIGYSHQKRFKLRSIEEPDGNKYTFKYYDDGSPLPSRLTQGIDHWGYLNGALGNITLIGEDAFRVCTNNQFGNKTATNAWSQYGTLTAISHSTGGTTFLEYENHKARNYTPIIGGSRIKKIMYFDSVSNLKTTKRYDYQQVNGKSSGFLCLKPFYHFDDRIDYAGLHNEYWHSGLYQQLLSESGRSAVGYSRVKETILTGDETDSLGYTISEFLQPLTEINIQEIVTYNCVTQLPPTVPYPITTCDTNRYIRPWKWNPYHENTIGVSSRVAVYGKTNQLLSEKSSVYTEQQLQITSPNNYQQNYRSFRLVDKNYNFEQGYFEFFNTFRVTSDTTKMYSQDGTNPVVNITSYEYPTQAKHNQLIKTTTKDSYGSTLTNTMKYPLDFQFGMNPPNNPEVQGIQALQQKHILGVVIESISRTKQAINSSDEFITSASYQTFYKADSVGVKAGMPKASFGLENLPRLSMTEANYEPLDNTFVRSSDYDLKVTTNAYTSIGLPIQSTPRFGPVSKTNYDTNYPTLPISQVSNVGQPSEQTTSTTYGKILYGVSKQTGVNGLSINNEFYADGKLKQQTDKDGNVLKHIQYVYRGQADNDPHVTTNTGYNRVITRIPRFTTTDALNLGVDSCMISIQYFDGSGRSVQNIGFQASPNKKDMISGVVDYDKFNRLKRQWLTVESTQNTGALLDTATVKTIARAFYQDQKPYSEVLEYESSPMSRVFKSYGVGKVFQDSSKYVQMEHQTATGIKRLFVNNTDDYMAIGTYSGYQLSKSISTDERGSKVIEYKDKSGNTVQRDVQVDATNYLTTLFAFDAAGRLRFTFPPKAVIALGNSTGLNVESWAEFNENVYATHYDGRNRAYESHKPGAGWSRAIYNRMNQAVMSQDDDELAKNNTWNYAQTDGQGRGIRNGQMQLPATYTRAYLQGLFDAFVDNQQFEERDTIHTTSFRKYTNRSFPTALRTYINDATWKNIHYFDDYKFRYTDGSSGTIAQYGFQVNPYNSTAYSVTNAKGLMTGGLHKIDNFGDFAFPSVVYYDDKNRSIQSIIYQDLYARNQSDTKYNFVGESLINQSIYRKSGDLDRIITKENTLDHVGRSKDFYYTLKEGTVDKVPRIRMNSLFYDNIGRLQMKVIEPKNNVVSSLFSGNWTTASIWTNNTIPSLTTPAIINQGHIITIPANTTVQAGTLYDAGKLTFLTNAKLQLGILAPVRGAGLQTIEYSYNVRGQMRGVNLDASGNSQVSQDKLFSYKIDYYEDSRYFDNSISKQTWKALNDPQNRSYLYSYDRSNRLTNSQYTGVGNENYSISNSYDANGNILTLQRYSKTGANMYGLVDNLTYSYLTNGNKLQQIDDGISGNALANDFRDVSGNDYSFSVDGKLTKDNNKSIFNIKYNFLDLVSKITFNDSTKVEYFYTSTGERRQRKVTKNGVTSYTLYDGEIVYTFTGVNTSLNDFKVSEIQNPEGRYVNGKLEYGYTDHVGNLRLSYKDSLGVAFITQSQSYDPWSNINAGSEYQLSGNQGDKYFVSGKENDSVTGNTLLDWRDYDSVTGRMNSYDPDGSEGGQISLSPFAYSWNRPSMLNDPDGRCPMCIGALIGIFTSTIGNLASGKQPSSIGQFLLPGVQGAIGGGIASAIGGGFAGMSSFAGKGLLQAGAHALSGGLQSAAFGGNFWQGAASSGISSGFASGADGLGLGGLGQLLGGGLAGGISAELFGGNFWDGARDGLIVSGLNHLSHGGGEQSSDETNLFELLGAKNREPYTGFWGNAEYYWTGGNENGLHYGKDGSIIGFAPMGGDGPGISPAGKILKYGKLLSKSDFRGLKSHYRQIIEHTTKLREYMKDPHKFDNLGILAKNASNPAVVRRIISTRISHLKHEIKTFSDNIDKILTRNGF
jgi:RHS repeat-associated protein